jgi:hypothetical protein
MEANAKKPKDRTTQATIKTMAANRMRGIPDAIIHREANALEAEAADILDSGIETEVASGEVAPYPEGDSSAKVRALELKDTLEHPTQITRDASADRMAMLLDSNIDITALALDMATSIRADNSLEKGLAHQMALAHTAAFRMISQGMAMLEKASSQRTVPLVQLWSTEGTRLINSGNRMMQTYQQGMATLAKFRRGGKQTMTVQHVNVSDGGQALIGNVEQGGVTPKDGKNEP